MLQSMAAWIDATRSVGRHGVLACSALKRGLSDGSDRRATRCRLIFLRGDKALIGGRQAARHNHFMPATLLDSQFAVLEEPGEDEHAIVVSVSARPLTIVEDIVRGVAGVSDVLKRLAAEASLESVRDGMVLGLGTGSTAALIGRGAGATGWQPGCGWLGFRRRSERRRRRGSLVSRLAISQSIRRST